MLLKLVLLLILAFQGCRTTSIDIRGVLNGNQMAGIPLGVSMGIGELDVEGICTQSGMACVNCTHSVTCVALPVGWLKVPLEECTEGLTCNARVGRCSKDPVPECDIPAQKFQHTCEQVGVFPDAYNCRKFHLCSPPEGLLDGKPADHRAALCPRHYGYNPQTAQCSIQLTHGQCDEKPVPDCKEIGQHGVLSSSTNHYYVCLFKNGILHPQVFICPHGWHFWGNFCRPEPETKSDCNSTDVTVNNSVESSEEEVNITEAINPSTTKIDSFFSTEKSSTYPADTFLADKYDLSNYETIDDVETSHDEFVNSFETEFWQ